MQEIEIKNIATEIRKTLDSYQNDIGLTLKSATKKVVEDTVKELKETSPKDTGKYASGWAKTINDYYTGIEGVIFNKRHYQLTHLLEKPHLNRAGKLTTPKPHIKKAEEKAVKNFKKLVEQGVSK